MKKCIVLALLLTFVITVISGCSVFETVDDDLFKELPDVESSQDSVIEENKADGKQPAEPAPDSLWNKNTSIRVKDIPPEAYASGAVLCTGITRDGKRLLMSGGGAVPYLWDTVTGESIPVYFGDDNQEWLSSAYEAQYGKKLEGEALLEGVFWTGAPLTPVLPDSNIHDDGYMLVRIWNFTNAVLDTDTGALYLAEGGGNIGGIYGQEILSYTLVDDYVALHSFDGNHGTFVNFGKRCELEECTVNYATVLADGSICAVLRDVNIDYENGQECFVMVKSAEGKFESFCLGKINFGWEPDMVVSVGEDWLIAANIARSINVVPYLIERESGEVYRLVREDGEFKKLTPEEFDRLDSYTGVYGSSLFLSTMADGKTAIFYDAGQARFGLFCPDQMQSRWLDSDEKMTFLPPVAFSGNGCDRFLYFRKAKAVCIIEIETE